LATEKQIAANRANAKKSTGPRTLAGKLKSSRNAYRHGLSSPSRLQSIMSAQTEVIVSALIGVDQNEEKLLAAAEFAAAPGTDADPLDAGRLDCQGRPCSARHP
jgi:hypothetical protein